MPSESSKQHRFFEWIDHTPGAAEKAGVPKSVAHEFVEADKGHVFKSDDHHHKAHAPGFPKGKHG